MEIYNESDACPTPMSSTEDPLLEFGKHRGKPVSAVPLGYIMWMLVDQNRTTPYARGNYEWIKANQPPVFQAMKRRLLKHIKDL